MNSNTLRRVCLSAALAFALCGTAVAQDQQFLRTTSRTPSFETDFTVAAEKTVNSVVCIQSYETPRQQYYGNPFGDFFDFFGWGMPQQQQPQQQKKQKQEPQQTWNRLRRHRLRRRLHSHQPPRHQRSREARSAPQR